MSGRRFNVLRAAAGEYPWEDEPGAHCRSGCLTRDHASWGDCVRAANIGVDRTALAKGRE